jgi:REP element-mobilizing transposase RayT
MDAGFRTLAAEAAKSKAALYEITALQLLPHHSHMWWNCQPSILSARIVDKDTPATVSTNTRQLDEQKFA